MRDIFEDRFLSSLGMDDSGQTMISRSGTGTYPENPVCHTSRVNEISKLYLILFKTAAYHCNMLLLYISCQFALMMLAILADETFA